MKNAVKLFILSILCASCSLEEVPQGYVTKETFYKTEEQCKSALRACYTPIHHIYGRSFLLATEACADLFFLSSSSEDAVLSITPAKPGAASTVWQYGYKGVARANECVECISASPLSDYDKLPMVAEARAMRALYYYVLTSFLGDVPFYTEAVSDIEMMEKIRLLPRTDASIIRDSLYRDLKENALPYFTEENGLRCRANQVSDQHSGYALSLMLMAKFAMWNNEWENALYALDLLEETYGTLTEENFPLEKTQWRYQDEDENIFEIRHAWSASGVKFYGNLATLLTPKSSGSWIYDGVYMPELGETGVSSTPMRIGKHLALYRSADNAQKEHSANKLGIYPALPMKLTSETYDTGTAKRYCSTLDLNAFETGYTANGSVLDRRIQYMVGMGNISTGDTFEAIKTGGFFYGGAKFWCPGMTGTYDSNSYPVFRYADAVLMQAECHAMLGHGETGVHYLDCTRIRAGLPAYEYTTEMDLLREIQNERARELGGEFQRKFDLVRWGIWYEVTRQYNEEARVRSNIRRCHRFYPIPDTECALSNGVLSNPEYNN